jgi:FAD/FMN-containing dehydrogenase/Fe-S oxidoreductase
MIGDGGVVVELPDPVVVSAVQPKTVDTLERRLRNHVDAEVRFDAGSRGAYATDASNYRQVPIGVVVPRSVEAAADALRICADAGVPVLSRGGGTSLAGECCNVAVVVDWSKYCNQVESIDAEARTAIVQPGLVLDELNAACAAFGLMYGPKPATHSHCTIGGMIGNNSCGSSAQAYGKTVDNISRLEILTYDGTRMWVGRDADHYDQIVSEGGRPAEIYSGLRAIVQEYQDDIRARFVDIPRRVSGYNLDSLLPENGFDVAKALVGSESTLVTVLRAEVTLVPVVPVRRFVVMGYPGIAEAADAVPALLPHQPLILEGMDDKLINHERSKHMHPTALDLLPDGKGWLILQLGADDEDEADRRAADLVHQLQDDDDPPSIRVFDDPDDEALIMEVRESGLGATAWVQGEHSTWPGWEDAAVPPDRLGAYLRDFSSLLEEFGYQQASLYGHFGQGCVHTRIPFELTTTRGIEAFRTFLTRAAHLVTRYGGSLSGEHGDGQARGPLLPIMFGDRLVEGFRATKALLDPGNRMNPGKVVDSYGVDQNLRLGADYNPAPTPEQQFSYPRDKGTFANAALRCVGVGNCRSHDGGVMCPSYRATGEEEHSTRGRSRLLFEMVNGGRSEQSPITQGWRSTAVRDALDLCLSCKGCKSDCPVNVDMATYKAEFLSHHYAGRVRPAAHYSMGWLPVWARLAHLAPGLVNRLAHLPVLARWGKRLGGVEPDRPVPFFAKDRFTDWYAKRGPRGSGMRGEVLLWPDTFSNNLHPAVAKAAVEVLEDAGYRVLIPDQTLCCGLTWISTGQLDTAKRVLLRTAKKLSPYLRRGVPVVGLEPSCTAVFRSDAPDLLPEDPDVKLLQQQTKTLAEVLQGTPGWRPPIIDRRAVVQPHCHHHAVLAFDEDATLMERAGISARTVGGCCGLAGNFGFEKGHLEVSLTVAEHDILPAVRAADPDALIIADGFSCRTQIEQAGGGRQALHLAEVLAAGLRGARFGDRPEADILERPGVPQQLPQRRLRKRAPFAKSGEPM